MADFVGNEPATVQQDGLRYKAKPSGTPFKTSALGSTMSCLLCGQHILRTEGTFKKIFNARQFVCFACRPPKPEAPTA
jgi:hypothetical protein